jgi:hypothetical protein
MSMARVRSTARLTAKGAEQDIIEIGPILEVMRESGIVDPKAGEEVGATERSDFKVEVSSDEEDPSILRPNKPSHLEFGVSTVKAEDLDVLKKLGYIGQKEDDMTRFDGSEIIHEPKDDEVVVFRSFFPVGLHFSMYEMIAKVLKKFEIYLH